MPIRFRIAGNYATIQAKSVTGLLFFKVYLRRVLTAKHILLVEDDSDDEVFFMDAINRIHPSIKCDIAHNGVEALKKLSIAPRYDIIFMDLNMPVMDGFTCLDKLKQTDHNNVPVVMLTTSKNPKDIERCKRLGASMYCIKPASFDELFEKLKTIVTKGIKFFTY